MKHIIFPLIAIAAGSTMAIAGELFPRSEPRKFVLAEQLEENATLAGYPVWRGEGKWRIYELRKIESGGSARIPLGIAGFFQTENRKFVARFGVAANLNESGSVEWNDEPCKREDFLYKESIGGRFSNINCVSINHIASYFATPTGAQADLFALIKAEEVVVPPTVLRITFTRHTTGARRVAYELDINPEFFGFQPATEPNWVRNEWHKSQSFSNPEKKRLIDALSVWALAYVKQMDAALNRNTDAFQNINSWRQVLANGSSTEPTKLKLKLD